MPDINLIKETDYRALVITTNHHQLDLRFYALNAWRFDWNWGYDDLSNTSFLGWLSYRKKHNGEMTLCLPSVRIELSSF